MNIDTSKSQSSLARASKVLVGGVNSPVRAFSAVDANPLFISKANGSKIYDVDGNEFIDYVGSYGPMIVGHAHELVTTAITKAVRNGTSFGAPTTSEFHLAEAIVSLVDSIEMVRFTNSGTEATMTAIRLARGYTGRDKIIKFKGCYHGHSDALLVQAGSGATTLGAPSSPGIPAAAVSDTILLDFNNQEQIEKVFAELGDKIAAVLIEPIAGNMGVVPPAKGYLEKIRALCTDNKALLIFDEVMTGFRVNITCAQGLYGITPDLTALGKIIGGGMPVGAVGGPAKIMQKLSPVGNIYQAGTLSGNPAAMSAGIETMNLIRKPGFYEQLEEHSSELHNGLVDLIRDLDLEKSVTINRVGSMLSIFFASEPVTDYSSACKSNTKAFAAWFNSMLDQGIYLPPSQFEAIFVSAAHTDSDIRATLIAAKNALICASELL